MIEFNGKQYSGSVVREDDTELIITISTQDSLQDVCLALNNVREVIEVNSDVTSVHNVNNATNVGVAMPGVYAIKFSQRLSIIEEMNEAINDLLVMVLEN